MPGDLTSKTIAIPERELWSLVRSILEQGRDIQVDYAHGVYSSYEHCSARVDEAARERADKLLQKYGTAVEPSSCPHCERWKEALVVTEAHRKRLELRCDELEGRCAEPPKVTDEDVADARRWIDYLESQPQHEPDISIAKVLRDLVQFYEWALPQFAQPAEPPSAWQPIETAPQGDAIVWLPDKGAVMARLCGDLWYDLTTGWLCEPTLWAPMPAGPSETKPEIPARDELNGESPRAGASVGQPSRAGTPHEKYIGCDGCGMEATGRCPYCQALSCDGCATCEHHPGASPEWRRPVETSAPQWKRREKNWSEYPVGTVARQSWSNSRWTKVENGWKAHGGDTFPTPGGADQVAVSEEERACIHRHGRRHHS